MIEIKVCYFAVLRGMVDQSEEIFHVKKGTTVQDLLEQIVEVHPSLLDKIHRIAIAVNHSYATVETELQDQDEVALIPPVGGG